MIAEFFDQLWLTNIFRALSVLVQFHFSTSLAEGQKVVGDDGILAVESCVVRPLEVEERVSEGVSASLAGVELLV